MYSTKELYSAFRTHSQSTELQKILRVELYYMYSKTYLLVQYRHEYSIRAAALASRHT